MLKAKEKACELIVGFCSAHWVVEQRGREYAPYSGYRLLMFPIRRPRAAGYPIKSPWSFNLQVLLLYWLILTQWVLACQFESNLVPTLERGWFFLGGETCRQPIFIYKEVWKLSSQKPFFKNNDSEASWMRWGTCGCPCAIRIPNWIFTGKKSNLFRLAIVNCRSAATLRR